VILRCLQVFKGGLRQNLYHWQVYSSVPHVNRGETGKTWMDTSESGQKVRLISSFHFTILHVKVISNSLPLLFLLLVLQGSF